jgi:hypothetical protein
MQSVAKHLACGRNQLALLIESLSQARCFAALCMTAILFLLFPNE